MYQIITSSIVNSPPSSYAMRMLHPSHSQNSAPLYVPANGTKSGKVGAQAPTDTKEDMLELFATDVNGQPREMKRLMGRRNYAIFCVFDPEAVEGAFAAQGLESKGVQPQGAGRVSLAVDLMVQSDGANGGGIAGGPPGMPGSSTQWNGGGGAFGAVTVKYGPVIVPNLEYGR